MCVGTNIIRFYDKSIQKVEAQG